MPASAKQTKISLIKCYSYQVMHLKFIHEVIAGLDSNAPVAELLFMGMHETE